MGIQAMEAAIARVEAFERRLFLQRASKTALKQLNNNHHHHEEQRGDFDVSQVGPPDLPLDPTETMAERLIRVGVDAIYWENGDTIALPPWHQAESEIVERLLPGRATLAVCAGLVAESAAACTHGVFTDNKLTALEKTLMELDEITPPPRFSTMYPNRAGEGMLGKGSSSFPYDHFH